MGRYLFQMINLFIVDPESPATKSLHMENSGRKIGLFNAATLLAMPTLLASATRDLSIFQVPTYGASRTVNVVAIQI
jgi:hypothetical protein